MMSYWMQILDLRCPKQIYWIVYAVLTDDLGEWKKTSLTRSQHWCRLWVGAKQRAIQKH